jgi:hypothetical protein
MSVTSTLVQEKLDQAAGILREQDVDLWLTFVRETSLTNDPCLDLIAGTYSAWTGAFLVAANGERIAIVGRFDAPAVEQTGGYEVVGYDESIKPALRDAVERLAPRTIALNYSESDPAADGLTHGLWLVLRETFAETDRREPVRVVRGDRQCPEGAQVAGGGRPHPRCRARDRGDLRRRDQSATRRPRRARGRGSDARGGRATRPRLRVGSRPLPCRERRSGEGDRSRTAG